MTDMLRHAVERLVVLVLERRRQFNGYHSRTVLEDVGPVRARKFKTPRHHRKVSYVAAAERSGLTLFRWHRYLRWA